jgi:hypothetical protein
MEISHLTDQGSGHLNDDSLLVGSDIFGVFDGASDLLKYRDKQGNTGAKIASQTATNEFAKNNRSLPDLAAEANTVIRNKMVKAGIDLNNKGALWSTTCAVVRIDEAAFEWVQISDSAILTIYQYNTAKLISPLTNHDFELVPKHHKLALQGLPVSEVRAKLLEEDIKLRNRTNIDYGFMNGEKEMKKFLKSGKESLEGVKHILLFTDGLFIPQEKVWQKLETNNLVELFLAGGLQKNLETVRNLENSDINCIKYPRFKTHDDATAVALSF